MPTILTPGSSAPIITAPNPWSCRPPVNSPVCVSGIGSIMANALGFVEISTNNGGSWNQISPTYTYANTATSGGVWSRPSIDLSAFAGQSVQIAFHFTSGGCCGNAQGWYVDDVAVVTNSPVLNDPESFESVTNDWAVDFGTWEIGRPTTGPAANAVGLRAHSGTNCAATVLAGNYANNVDSRLISPPFVVPASNSPAFRFWHWYNFNNALGFVEITTDGSTWNTTITDLSQRQHWWHLDQCLPGFECLCRPDGADGFSFYFRRLRHCRRLVCG